MIQKSNLIKNSLVLSIVIAIVIGVSVLVHNLLKEHFVSQETAALRSALRDIYPQTKYDNILDSFCRIPNHNDDKDIYIERIYQARKNDTLDAYIVISNTSHGYGGNIKILSVVDAQGVFIGMTILDHKETPGYGDYYVEDDKFSKQFIDKKIADIKTRNWNITRVGGSFDYKTGATITARALLNSFKGVYVNALEDLINNPKLFNTWQSCKTYVPFTAE